jgi:hypothetical protein
MTVFCMSGSFLGSFVSFCCFLPIGRQTCLAWQGAALLSYSHARQILQTIFSTPGLKQCPMHSTSASDLRAERHPPVEISKSRPLVVSLDMGYIQQVIEGRYIDKEKLLDLLIKEFGRGNFQVRVRSPPAKFTLRILMSRRYSLTAGFLQFLPYSPRYAALQHKPCLATLKANTLQEQIDACFPG